MLVVVVVALVSLEARDPELRLDESVVWLDALLKLPLLDDNLELPEPLTLDPLMLDLLTLEPLMLDLLMLDPLMLDLEMLDPLKLDSVSESLSELESLRRCPPLRVAVEKLDLLEALKSLEDPLDIKLRTLDDRLVRLEAPETVLLGLAGGEFS